MLINKNMELNSHMLFLQKIILISICTVLGAEMLPENGSSLNYTQVFFRWEQIPNVESYQFTIMEMESEEAVLNVIQNSILLTEFLNWNSTYTWFICGLFDDGSTPFCSEIYSLTINPLPSYFPDVINVTNYNESFSQEGVTMMDFESLDFSGGLDKNGTPIWFVDRDEFAQKFIFTQFLSNGNVVGFGPGVGYEIDLDGHIIFETPNVNSLHHQFTKTNKDTYFFISATVEDQYCPEECNPNLPDEIPWQGDIFREFDQEGNEIWSWNTFDYYGLTEYNPYYVETYTGSYEMDWTHSNSVFYDNSSESVFVSSRNLSRITKIDYASKDLIWNMGQTDFMDEIYFEQDLNFSHQHSVQVLDNGNLLFFDNHHYLSPELSRCLEVSYDESDYSAEIVWEHVLPADLFSGSRGECDRLENGNTLITAGRTGNTLEVTHENEVVWQIEIENTGVDVVMYRSARIHSLYPIAFSLGINEYIGNVDNNYVEPINGLITANIFNSGWGEDWYIYMLHNASSSEMVSDSVFVHSFENTSFNVDVSGLPTSTYILEVYPAHSPEKLQSFQFNLLGSISLGDMNSDNILDVLDIIILVNLILISDESNPSGDINQDGNQNILDIISLVNLILDN